MSQTTACVGNFLIIAKHQFSYCKLFEIRIGYGWACCSSHRWVSHFATYVIIIYEYHCSSNLLAWSVVTQAWHTKLEPRTVLAASLATLPWPESSASLLCQTGFLVNFGHLGRILIVIFIALFDWRLTLTCHDPDSVVILGVVIVLSYRNQLNSYHYPGNSRRV